MTQRRPVVSSPTRGNTTSSHTSDHRTDHSIMTSESMNDASAMLSSSTTNNMRTPLLLGAASSSLSQDNNDPRELPIISSSNNNGNNNDGDDDGGIGGERGGSSRCSTSCNLRKLRNNVKYYVTLMMSPITGEEGPNTIWMGLLTLVVIGTIMGTCIMPVNQALPTVWYRYASSAIGWIYFVQWSVSFYPQVITNYKRKTTFGLSADFCALNVLGFACYSTYNLCLYFSPAIREQYRHRHAKNGDTDAEITVQLNDVAFATHAFLLATLTLTQIGYYDGFHIHTSKTITTTLLVLLFIICTAPVLIVSGVMEWLDYLYMLANIKVLITLIKYVPQVILNTQRKSTQGFNIWQILLDFSGGMLSDLQLIFDCLDMNDWTGITGNIPKFCLGFVSIVFDTIFMLQHYVWYPQSHGGTAVVQHHLDGEANTSEDGGTTSLL